MAAFDYDCPTQLNQFIQESNRYINEVASKALPYTPWLANTPRGTWDRAKGPIQQSIVWERTVPNGSVANWVDTVNSDGASNNGCALTGTEIHFGQTTRTMRRQRSYYYTEDFCLEDVLDDLMIDQFLAGVGENLGGVTAYIWAARRRAEYSRLSDHKLTEDGTGALDLDASSWDVNNPPTSKLLNGTLEQIYDYLMLNGVHGKGSIGMAVSGKQVFPLITDAGTARDLIRQDPELREDFRWAYAGMQENSPLMTAYGMGNSYNGFKTVIDYPRRWDIVNGAWVEREPYADETATTKGYKQELDPLYRYAEFQDSVIHIPTVYKELVQVPRNNLPGGFQFSPQNYMGDFMFQVIKDRKCNPRGKTGYFDAEFVSASQPGLTWHGFIIRHRNCIPSREPRACSQYEVYS